MQGKVRNLPAHQRILTTHFVTHTAHAKWAYGFTQPDCVPLLHDCRPRQKEIAERNFPEIWENLPAHMRLDNAI
eukprot:1280515-Prymnesium_polylepis.1